MNAKSTIRKTLFIAFWCCIGGGLISLLLAAISRKNNGICADYTIRMLGNNPQHFVDANDIKKVLFDATKGPLKGDPIASLDLFKLEKVLEKDNWIASADLYFDNKDILHVNVTEIAPVARVFCLDGYSFYINSKGETMPLSDKRIVRMPVFSGYKMKSKLNAADSSFLMAMKNLAEYIARHSFWQSQIAQINITQDHQFELVPLVGHNIIKFGDGNDIDAKFHRLMVFYKQVLSKTGFDRYKSINVQYKGQVVVSNSTANTKVDKVQLKKNVENLIGQNTQPEKKAEEKISPAKEDKTENEVIPEQENESTVKKQKPDHQDKEEGTIKNQPKAEKVTTKETVTDENKTKTVRKPKAIMPPRVKTENEKKDE